MKYFIILIFTFLFSSCKDDNHIYLKFYYPNGKLKKFLSYTKDSVRDGISKEFYKNGHIKYQTWSHNGINTDSFFVYHKNGKIKEKGYVINSRKIGWWKYYDTLGHLIKKEEFLYIKDLKHIPKINDSIYHNQEIIYNKNGKIDSVKSRFYTVNIKDTLQAGYNKFKLHFSPFYKEYCKSHDTCGLVRLDVLVYNECKNKIDTFRSRNNTIEFYTCFKKTGKNKIYAKINPMIFYWDFTKNTNLVDGVRIYWDYFINKEVFIKEK